MRKAPVRFLRGPFFYPLFIFFLLIALPGCATVAGSFDPQINADRVAQEARLEKLRIPAKDFTLTSYLRFDAPGKSLTVYIEGDGRAWLSKDRLSDDPTPVHPLVLQLASKDPSPNVAYLARPCQYDRSCLEKPCGPVYWSDKRFSEEVIASINEAVDRLKEKVRAPAVHLVGYSGGAAVAVLVAARRNDIASLRTVAGNLDPNALNRYHHVSPMNDSLDPMQVTEKISRLPQRHFIGDKDQVVPAFITKNYQDKIESLGCSQVIELKGVTHYNGWLEHASEIADKPTGCAGTNRIALPRE